MNEVRRHPVAAIAALASILALVPIIVAAVQFTTADNVTVEEVPFAASELSQIVEPVVGQLTAPTAVVPRALSDIPRPPNPEAGQEEFLRWRDSVGGVLANEMGIAFTVTGESTGRTLITGVTIDVVERRPPLGGTWIKPGGGDAEPARILIASLDESPPSVRLAGVEEWNFPLSVSSEDLEFFAIVVQSRTCDCSWVARISYVDVDGQSQTAVLDDNGRPFRLTSSVNATENVNGLLTARSPWPN